MQRFLGTLALCLLLLAFVSGRSQTTNIPDPVFEQLLIQAGLDGYPLNGSIATASIDTVTSLNLYTSSSSINVTDLTGIEAFTALTYLMVNYAELTELDLSENFALEEVHAFGNDIANVVLPASETLAFLDVSSNPLIGLDVSQNPGLISLVCYYLELNELDVTSNEALKSLSCSFNQLTELDLSQNPNLEMLYCAMNSLTMLDLSQNLNLEDLNCSYNQLAELDVSQLDNLSEFHCSANELTTLDVSQNNSLDFLNCSANQITSLDASNHPLMMELFCDNNALTSLELSAGLIGLDCDHNQLELLNVSMVENLAYFFDCSFNPLTCVQVSASQLADPIAGWIVDLDDSFAIDCDYTAREEVTPPVEFIAYPNPSQGTVRITWPGCNAADLFLFSMQGKEIRHFLNVYPNQTFNLQLPNGVYGLSVMDAASKNIIGRKTLQIFHP